MTLLVHIDLSTDNVITQLKCIKLNKEIKKEKQGKISRNK